MIEYLRYLSTINEVVQFPAQKFVSVFTKASMAAQIASDPGFINYTR